MSTLTTNYQLLAEKYLGSSYGDLYVRLYAKYSEQDIANNKSKVQYQSRAYFTGNYIYDQQGAGNVSGTSASTVSGSCPQPTRGETVIATTEAWVPHNSDGTMSISASAYLNFPNWGWSATASADATLPTIPRATACPNLDGYIESSAPISLNPASTSFKHRLYYSYNGKTGYYPSSSGFFANTGSLPLDTSFYSYTPKSSGTGSITLYTYDSNGNLIGSKTGSITVRCDADKCRPSISATIVDINEKTKALTGDNTKLVKGFSNAQVTYSINAKNGASIKSKTINGKTLGTSPYTISGVSTGTFEIKAIDSRDFPKTITKTNTLVNYIPLTLDFNAFRPTPTGSAISINFQGNYFNGSFGSVNNELSLSWKYRVKGASSWEDGGTFVKDTDYTISGNRFYSIGDRVLSDTLFDYQTNYEISVYYADKLVNTYAAKPVPKGQPVLSWEDLLVNINGKLGVTDTITAGDVKCKNLLNINATPHKTYYSSPTVNGDTLTTSGSASNYFAYLIDVKPNTNYILSVSSKTGNVGIYDDSVSTYITATGNSDNSITFNSGSHEQITVVFYGDGTYEKPQLEEGTTATEYTPYKEFDNDKTFATQINKNSIGDYGTHTFKIEKPCAYLYINSHVFMRCMVFITVYENTVNMDTIFTSDPVAVPKVTLSGDDLTITAQNISRAYLYKLNNVRSA